jgi:hypothetical protein
MKEAGDTDARLARWFRGHGACHELVIEDLLAEDVVSDGGALRLEEVFGVRIVARAPGRCLRHDDFRALIANRADLIAAFAGGPHEGEAREILG